MFKKWFVAMVASWTSDEVVNQHVLVLIGKQGIYKTTWLERLLPPELRGYGSKLANLHDLTKVSKLTWQGTIKHPMSLSAFGKLLSAKGFSKNVYMVAFAVM